MSDFERVWKLLICANKWHTTFYIMYNRYICFSIGYQQLNFFFKKYLNKSVGDDILEKGKA